MHFLLSRGFNCTSSTLLESCISVFPNEPFHATLYKVKEQVHKVYKRGFDESINSERVMIAQESKT